jgi:GNAT superfamily N-acetyltransferase
MQTVLRTAAPEDRTAIARVLIDSRRESLPYAQSPHTEEEILDWVSSKLIPTGSVTVATCMCQVVAVLATSQDATSSWIDQLYVKPGYYSKGLGTKLLQHAHTTLTRPVRLYTFQANNGARRFYERHGYEANAFSEGQSNEEKCPDVLYELKT